MHHKDLAFNSHHPDQHTGAGGGNAHMGGSGHGADGQSGGWPWPVVGGSGE